MQLLLGGSRSRTSEDVGLRVRRVNEFDGGIDFSLRCKIRLTTAKPTRDGVSNSVFPDMFLSLSRPDETSDPVTLTVFGDCSLGRLHA